MKLLTKPMFVIINGTKSVLKQFDSKDDAITHAQNYCDHSLEVIVREVTEFIDSVDEDVPDKSMVDVLMGE